MESDRPDFLAVDWNGTVVPFFGAAPHRDARAILERLRANGVLIFIVSRAPQSVIEADVARVGLGADGVFGCGDKGPVLSDLRALHGRGCLVGDTGSDQRAARESGLDFLQARLEGEAALPGARGMAAWAELPDLLVGAAPDA